MTEDYRQGYIQDINNQFKNNMKIKLSKTQLEEIKNYAGMAATHSANSIAKLAKLAKLAKSAKSEKMTKVTLTRNQWSQLEKKAKLMLRSYYFPRNLTEEQYSADKDEVFKDYLEKEAYDDEKSSGFERNLDYANISESERTTLVDAVHTYFAAVRRLHQLNSIPEEVQKINFPRTQSNDVSDIWTAMETNGPWDKQTLKIIADILDSSELCIGLDVNDFANIYEIIDSLMDEKADAIETLYPWQNVVDPSIQIEYEDPQDR